MWPAKIGTQARSGGQHRQSRTNVGYSGSVRHLRIAHVLEKAAFTTGSVWQMFEAARGLAARRHHVVVITRPDVEMAERCLVAGIEHVGLPLRSQFDVLSMRRLAQVCRERKVMIVHAHRGIAQTVALGATHFGDHRGLIVSRGVTFPPGLATRLVMRSARVHRVVCACEAVRRAVLDHVKVPPAKVAVVYPSVDPSRFDRARLDPERIRAELGLEAVAPLVVQVGIRYWKGWKVLLGGFARVHREHPAAHLLLVGCRTGHQRAGVTHMAAEIGLARRFTAMTARVDVPEILAAASIVVDASWAGTGVSGPIREAMALGLPVVATEVGGNAELVHHGVDGLLVPPRDVATLAAAISRLLRDRPFAEQLAAQAHANVSQRFSIERRAKELESCYRSVWAEVGAEKRDSS